MSPTDQWLEMDSTSTTHTEAPGLATKLKSHKFQLGVSFIVIALIAGVSGLTMSRKHETTHAKGHSNVHGGVHGDSHENLWQTFAQAVSSVQEKIDALKKADEENEKLRKENAHLRLVLESEHYEKYAEKAQKETQTFQFKLSKDTGSRTGRTLASVGYKIPQDLLPAQLYSLGLTYFKTGENEKAAVIFTFLTGLEGDDTFKTPGNHLLTGIAWYRIENFELANFYFDQVLQSSETKATRRVHGQAKLWKGMIAEKTGKHGKAQTWLRDVLDHDPHSVEARWINHSSGQEPEEAHEEGAQRKLASSEKAHEETHGNADEKPHEAAHEAHH